MLLERKVLTKKTAHRFLFVFGNHIASFIISSVRKLWNEHIWEWFLRIEKSCRTSLSCFYCDYEECIMLTFFHSFSCSNVGVRNVHWFFFSIFCSHSPNKEIASMVHCKSLVIPIGYHTCLLCHCLFSICCTNKIKETAAFERTQFPILFTSSALNVEHFTSCIFVHNMSYLDPGTNLTWTTTKPNAPKLSGGWLQMAVYVCAMKITFARVYWAKKRQNLKEKIYMCTYGHGDRINYRWALQYNHIK